MKKIFTGFLIFLAMSNSVQAYMIGGAYAYLISCDYGAYGYKYGNIGTYKVNGQIYQIFFGSDYCEY